MRSLLTQAERDATKSRTLERRLPCSRSVLHQTLTEAHLLPGRSSFGSKYRYSSISAIDFDSINASTIFVTGNFCTVEIASPVTDHITYMLFRCNFDDLAKTMLNAALKLAWSGWCGKKCRLHLSPADLGRQHVNYLARVVTYASAINILK